MDLHTKDFHEDIVVNDLDTNVAIQSSSNQTTCRGKLALRRATARGPRSHTYERQDVSGSLIIVGVDALNVR